MERVPTPVFLIPASYLLCALAITSTVPLYRRAAFIPILGIAIYVTHYTTAGEPGVNYQVACTVIALVFSASDFLILSDPHRELRTAGQETPADLLPFYERFKWAVHLLFSPRMITWTGEPSEILAPPPKQKTKSAFAIHLCRKLAVELLLLDALGISISRTPAFSSNGPSLRTYRWIWRSIHAAHFGFAHFISLDLMHSAWMLALTATGRWEPSDFRPMHGALSHAYTIRKFWGRTWHQLLRRRFHVHAQLITQRILRLPRGQLSSYINLYTAFFISGFIHHWAEYMLSDRWNSGSMHFLLAQAIAIHCEDILISVATRLGVQESRTWRVLGYIWVWQWFAWSTPLFTDTCMRTGAWDNPTQLGILRTMCSITKDWCPLPLDK